MAQSVFDAPQFQTEAAAFAYVEAHLWPHGPVCPHCRETDRVGRLNGRSTRAGLCKCYACKKPFTVRMGSVFESSHLPLHLWLQVIHLFCASKKGISTRQIQRMLQCSMKTAWFLGHRISEAMKEHHGIFTPPLVALGKSWKPMKPTSVVTAPRSSAPPARNSRLSPLSSARAGFALSTSPT